MYFGVRFDFRNPPIGGVSMADRYAAALDMAEWADGLGAMSLVLSEHHGVDDGYLPSPTTMAAAVATRAPATRVMFASLVAPFWHPLRLAEELCVLDHLTRGRVDVVFSGGYAPEEFEMFDVPMSSRPSLVSEMVRTLQAAFTGEPFEFRGRTVRVTPGPYRPGGPSLRLGGSSEGAARRAARLGIGFLPSTPAAWPYFADEVVARGGNHPGPCPVGDSINLAVVDDVERGWRELGPFFLHESRAYGEWQDHAGTAGPFRNVGSIDALRATGAYRLVTPDELVAEMRASPFPFQLLHPMCGGIPPDLAWQSLRLFEHEVLSAFR